MIQILLAVAITALLFALHGLLPHRGCTGHCAGCTGQGACQRNDHDGDSHAH
ncbi:MAG: hypothetical protein HY084_02015 [Gemmatimonadetes bacterium]|nr:hypothetical protein [Gemmatimonadota bacterium]